MSALWFVGFTVVWTAAVSAAAGFLTRGTIQAKFAQNVWRGAALLSVFPWALAGVYALLPRPATVPIPDLPYIGGAVETLSNSAIALELAEAPGAGIPIGWLLWGLLIAGWSLRSGQILLSQIRLQAIKRSAVPAPGLSTTEIANKLRLRRAPAVALRPNGSPFVAGIRHPTIYLPSNLDDMNAAEIILAHECTHIARGDLLTRPFERFVAELFWFSPFAWLIREQLDYWREAACDAQTLALTGDRVQYARVLAQTARLTRTPPARVSGLPVATFIPVRKAPLKRRLKQVLDPQGPPPRRTLALLACLGGILLAPLSIAQMAPPAGLGHGDFSHPLLISSHARIAASFGNTNYYGEMRWHAGVDIAAPHDACVHAPAQGTVLSAKFKGIYGNTVDILLEDGRVMRFANLEALKVKRGASVDAGDVIGTVGLSAYGVTRPHLHFEIFDHGEYVDPQEIEGLILIAGAGGQSPGSYIYLQR